MLINTIPNWLLCLVLTVWIIASPKIILNETHASPFSGSSNLKQASYGLQLGGQQYSEVIFFENAEAYERFVGNKFEFSAQLSAIALKAGVSLDAEYRDGILVFTQGIGGLMYEASVGGQKFKTEMY